MIKTSQFNPNIHLIYTIIIVHQLSWESMLPYWRLHTKTTQEATRKSNHTDQHTATTRPAHGCTRARLPSPRARPPLHGYCTATTTNTATSTAPSRLHRHEHDPHSNHTNTSRNQTRTHNLNQWQWSLIGVWVLRDQRMMNL